VSDRGAQSRRLSRFREPQLTHYGCITSPKDLNVSTGRSGAGKRGGKSGSYDDWSKRDLQERAKEIGIDGHSKMNKGELIAALRNH
jgi:hypothetical protein